jgi:hypothetical protein
MSTIVTRAGKGSPLTHNEVDANFTNLNTDKYQSGDTVTFAAAVVTGSATLNGTSIPNNKTLVVTTDIGTSVQAYDAQLADVAGLTPADNNFIVGNGTNFVTESGSTARTSLGLGSIATQDSSNVSISGGSISGITDLAVADGGTGSSTASGARTNLGLDGFVNMKNRIINGAMVIDQRNAGASVTATNAQYTLDRWSTTLTQASKFTVQQNSATNPVGFPLALVVTSSSAYSVLTGDLFTVRQLIEGFNVADLGWGTASAKTVTLSFWVRSSLTGTFGGSLTNSAANRFYPFTYTISVADTWEYKTITVAGDTTGTWLTNNGVGIGLYFGLGGGSTYSGTAGAWTGTGTPYTATGATSVVGTDGATFYITGVQLEVGSTATSFDYRPYGTELALCQRYYETGQIIRYGGATNVNQGCQFSQTFLVSKRAAPTITYASTSFSGNITAIGSANITTAGFVASFDTNGTGYGTGQGTMTASIEL